jgi:hypothetical protein
MGGRPLSPLNHSTGAFDARPCGGFNRWTFGMEPPSDCPVPLWLHDRRGCALVDCRSSAAGGGDATLTSYATAPRSRLRLAPSEHPHQHTKHLHAAPPLFLGTADHTKSGAEVVERRDGPVARRRPTIRGPAVPTAATAHAGRARCGARGVGHSTDRVISLPILTPLPHVAVHVIKAPFIRFSAADRLRVAVVTVPSVVA